jgi:hypothetical protein
MSTSDATTDYAAHQEYTSRRWPLRRLLRAAFLAGQGMSHADIAADEFVKSTERTVRNQLTRFGIRLRDAPRGAVRIDLRKGQLETFAAAGATRGVTADMVVARAVEILGGDPGLLRNVLDD